MSYNCTDVSMQLTDIPINSSIFTVALRPNAGHSLLIHDASQSVGLLWTSEQVVEETSTNNSIIKLKERSQCSVGRPSVTAIKLLVPEMLQHIFMEKISDRYIP